jgi:hypothetical protein
MTKLSIAEVIRHGINYFIDHSILATGYPVMLGIGLHSGIFALILNMIDQQL